MDQPTATIIGVLVGFIGGLVVAPATYQQKSDELFFKAIDFLGGGSQKRNLGIAAIELYWSNKRHRPVSVSLLVGSALYLLLQSGQKDAAHELHNLERIMTHLMRPDSRLFTSRSQYLRLLAAVRAARVPNRVAGLTVPASQLEEWERELNKMLGA
jgi:hypothetical protein